jgi:hypothetical protein
MAGYGKLQVIFGVSLIVVGAVLWLFGHRAFGVLSVVGVLFFSYDPDSTGFGS